jgi:hypothetical protein
MEWRVNSIATHNQDSITSAPAIPVCNPAAVRGVRIVVIFSSLYTYVRAKHKKSRGVNDYCGISKLSCFESRDFQERLIRGWNQRVRGGMSELVRVIGGGPAGSSAALSALRHGARVTVFEKTRFPRHKVCGEFLSPEAAVVFEKLGVLSDFLDLRPHAVTQANVFLGGANKRWKLDEAAFGISRHALDSFLLGCAVERGAELVREAAELHETVEQGQGPTVVAHGRHHSSPGNNRLFGFKAHYSGPLSDSVDLYFERRMYVGISCIENRLTDVCGLAPESLLREHGFEPDSLLASLPRLRERMRPLSRNAQWLITGPLVFGGKFGRPMPGIYPAGDALGFVDPITGSGILGALVTGSVAGRCCAQSVSSSSYLAECKTILRSQYHVASLFRQLVSWGLADKLAWLLPGQRLFDLTRPAVARAL